MSMPNKNIALQIAKEKKNIEDISRSTHLTTTASVTASATHATPDLSKIDQWDANFRTQFFTRLFNQILDVIEKEEKIPFIIGVANLSL
jgi:hypothetical protein